MAIIDGMIYRGDLRLPLLGDNGPYALYTEAEPCHMYVVLRVPLLPNQWADTTAAEHGFNLAPYLPQRIDPTFQIAVDDVDDDLNIKGYTSQYAAKSFQQAWSGAIATPTWQTTGLEDDEYPVDSAQFTNFPGTNPPLFFIIHYVLWSDDEGQVDGDFIEIESVNHDTVLDSAATEKIEWLSRNANKLYAPDMFFSAWHIKRVLLEGFLSMLANNTQSFNTPFCGYLIDGPF